MYVQSEINNDPLIVEGVRATNVDPTARYYDLKITSNGTIRKSLSQVQAGSRQVSTFSSPRIYLSTQVIPVTGTDTGGGGTDLTWSFNGIPTQDIILPEDGSYIFSFLLFWEGQEQDLVV